MTKSLYRSALCASSALVAAAAFTPAIAQVGEGTIDTTGDEVITITGSRIARPDLESAAPVTVVGAEDLAQTGTTRVEDLLNNLPQVFAGQTAFISNGASGTATVDLRNLGAVRTLVLVNGRRLQPGSPIATPADLNQIPSSLIERVEVSTGGASAIYGADAVSGVVNFIMDTDFEGVSLTGQVSFYQHNNEDSDIQDLLTREGNISPSGNAIEGFSYDVNLAIGAGTDDGRGHITAYAGYRQTDGVLQSKYDYSACALGFDSTDPTGYSCAGSTTSPNGRFFLTGAGPNGFQDLDGDGSADNDLFLIENQTFEPFTADGSQLYNYAPTNFFLRPDKRYTAGFFAEYEISEAITPYAEFMFMQNRSDAQIAFSGTFFANDSTQQQRCSNPFLSDTQRGQVGCLGLDPTTGLTNVDVDGDGDIDEDDDLANSFTFLSGKRFVEGSPRNNDIEHNSYRMTVGAKGDISENFRYDVFGQYGTSRYAATYENDLNISRIDQAFDATLDGNGDIVCRDPSNGCVPLNLFQLGGVTLDQFNFITSPALQRGNVEQFIVNGFISGDLGSIGDNDPIAVVLGAEYRKEQLEFSPDLLFETGGLAGQGGTQPPVNGEFSVREAFVEVEVPLLQGLPFAEELSIGGAYRISDYTSVGTEHTYTGKIDWQPVEMLRLRGSYSRAVRAPNINELFSPSSTGLFGGVDPCAGALAQGTPDNDGDGTGDGFTLAQCQNTGVTAAQYGTVPANAANQYNQLTGGNQNLDVEKADTYTAGVVVDGASFLPGFTATFDYFNIEIEDTISTPGAQNTLNQCALTGQAVFCDLVVRNAGAGDLFFGSDSTDGFVLNTLTNIGGLRTEGIDANVNYRRPFGAGGFNIDYTATYLIGIEVQNDPSVDFYDCAGFYGNTCGQPNPEYRHRLRVGYDADAGWGVTGGWRYFGSVDVDLLSSDPQLAGAPGRTPTVDDELDSVNWFDLTGYYDVAETVRFTVGVNNIFDKAPPLIGGAFGPSNGNAFPGVYDPLGRYIFVRGNLTF